MSLATRLAQQERDDPRNLLQVVLDVHTDCTGASERSPTDFKADVVLLKLALETWEKPSRAHWRFDETVRQLVRDVLDEVAAEE